MILKNSTMKEFNERMNHLVRVSLLVALGIMIWGAATEHFLVLLTAFWVMVYVVCLLITQAIGNTVVFICKHWK